MSNFTGMLEVDLVFPQNDSYAPTSNMPIIFAIQNPELASVLDIGFSLSIFDLDKKLEGGGSEGDYGFGLRWADLSGSNPYFEYLDFFDFNREGRWSIVWNVHWVNCAKEKAGSIGTPKLNLRYSGHGLNFTTKKSAQDANLVAATENSKCSEGMGAAFNITHNYDAPRPTHLTGIGTCVLVASPLSIPDPCRVKINPSAASSISASIHKRTCDAIALYNKTALPADCPQDKNAAQRVLVGGVGCLMAAAGVLGFIFM